MLWRFGKHNRDLKTVSRTPAALNEVCRGAVAMVASRWSVVCIAADLFDKLVKVHLLGSSQARVSCRALNACFVNDLGKHQEVLPYK